jgi:3-hydroxyisobutyrate dehydrogenase-like beta-hydroxyacid dehydrogenase
MKIEFIGLGTMGSGMAMNVLKGGHELVVHDINREAVGLHLEAGAAWADTPQQVKDVFLAVEVGREFDMPMRLANLTLAELTEALNRGWGQRDSRVAMLLQEERAGIDVYVPPENIQEILDGDRTGA